ncbi:restriction endonuclease subunit S [Armatimonas sp.]|uniref:restriction endonuclease subunit S n=1 Tax=Armatimonas sp. TaxID=1872638 RepID=UPI0037520D15
MSADWPSVPLRGVLNHRKEFIQIDDTQRYKRCRVQLHAQGILLRDEVSGLEIKTKSQQVCQAGEFLVAEIDAKMGGFGIVPEQLEGAVVSSHYFLFQIDESKLERRFLDWYSRTRTFRDQVTALGSTNYAAIRPSHVMGYTIPLPPLAEQHRIVGRIEEIVGKIEEARRIKDYTNQLSRDIITASINAIEFPETSWGKLNSVVSNTENAVRSGPFGSQLHHGDFVDKGIAAIGTRDVQTNRLLLQSGWFVTKEKFEEVKRYQVFPGDILVTIVGASIGRFCVVPDDVPLAFTTKHIQAVTVDKRVARPKFLSLMLNFHNKCRVSIFSQTQGSAQPSLNASKVLAIDIPLVEYSEQEAIVAYLDSLQAKTDALRREQQQTGERLRALLPAVLDRAFGGEL